MRVPLHLTPKKNVKFRFGVRAPDGRVSFTYTLVSQTTTKYPLEEVYIFPREAPQTKTSLHASGDRHTGLISEELRVKYAPQAPSRHVEEWKSIPFNGLDIEFVIVIPTDYLTPPRLNSRDRNKGVEWIEAAPSGQAILIIVLLGIPDGPFIFTEQIACAAQLSDERLIVVSYTIGEFSHAPIPLHHRLQYSWRMKEVGVSLSHYNRAIFNNLIKPWGVPGWLDVAAIRYFVEQDLTGWHPR